ncbi:hypothetical protein ACFX13_010104 [Malus domestica]
MASAPLLSPSLAPNKSQNDELLPLIGHPKFAVQGEIMMLVLVLLFATFLIALLLFLHRRGTFPGSSHEADHGPNLRDAHS